MYKSLMIFVFNIEIKAINNVIVIVQSSRF